MALLSNLFDHINKKILEGCWTNIHVDISLIPIPKTIKDSINYLSHVKPKK